MLRLVGIFQYKMTGIMCCIVYSLYSHWHCTSHFVLVCPHTVAGWMAKECTDALARIARTFFLPSELGAVEISQGTAYFGRNIAPHAFGLHYLCKPLLQKLPSFLTSPRFSVFFFSPPLEFHGDRPQDQLQKGR